MLVRHDGIMRPNLDPSIVCMMEEAKWISYLGLKVPPEAHSDTLIAVKQHHDQLKVSLRFHT